MRLTVEQSRKAFADHGCYVTEACDKCGKLLGCIRYTIRGKRGVWCSALCRDGQAAKPIGLCQGCGAPLKKRRGAKWCSDTCRVRVNRDALDVPNYPERAAHSKQVTGVGEGLGYSATGAA